MFNETLYSGDGACGYDATHRYGAADQHEYPTRALVTDVWPGAGYGRVLELGAGSGYVTELIARHATDVLAVEPVADMRRTLEARCAAAGLTNVRTLERTAVDLDDVPTASIDTALVIQSLHHFHRRPAVFRTLGRLVRPGGRLYVVEPYHNLRRVLRLLRKYLAQYRAPAFWRNERNWSTHDFVTRGEMRALCRAGGFLDVRFTGYWMPLSRRLVPDPIRRMTLEAQVSWLPLVRQAGAVLAIEARRGPSAIA